MSATVLSAEGGAWSGAAGTADGVHQVEVGSQFAIASITKNVIAAEIMWLAEEGLLELADSVSDHLPADFEFDTNGATIENLLRMESGIPDPTIGFSGGTDPLREWEPREVLASVPGNRNDPGKQFAYEDSNYMLLGLVIEATTGTSVATALRANVLSDPRLSSMVYQPEEQPTGPLALPFVGAKPRPNIVEAGGGYLPTKASASGGNGSGCMASDSAALALWGYLLFGGDLLTEQSLRAMTDFGSAGYGLGTWDLTNAGDGFEVSAVGHGGWDDGGYSAFMVVLPSEGTVISMLTNKGGDSWDLLAPAAGELASALGG